MALAGAISLGAGYYIAITTKNVMEAFTMFFLAVLLVIVGTYLIFTAGSICSFEGAALEQGVLLSAKTFYLCLGNALPDEAKCCGTGQYLYFEHRSPSGCFHVCFPLWIAGGYYTQPLSF